MQLGEEAGDAIEQWAGARTRDEVFRVLQEHSAPAGPVLRPSEVMNSEQMQVREFFDRLEHPVADSARYPQFAAPLEWRGANRQNGRSAARLFNSSSHKPPSLALEPRSGQTSRSHLMTTTTNGSYGHHGLLQAAERPGPLSGKRIIDFTWAWAGPYGSMQLALLGAELIKIESATRIDHSRQRSLAMGSFKGGVNQAPMFNEVNLQQVLDPTQPENRRRQASDPRSRTHRRRRDRQLPARHSLEKLGLGYEDLRQVNPDIVMVSASALGATGPERNYTGYAPTFAALSGLSYLSGEPQEPPVMMGGSIDLRAGTTAAAMAMLAGIQLPRQNRTGTVHRRLVLRGDRDAYRGGVSPCRSARPRRRSDRQRTPSVCTP